MRNFIFILTLKRIYKSIRSIHKDIQMQMNDNVSISFKITGYYDSTVTKKSVPQHYNSIGIIAKRKKSSQL